MLTATYHL